MTDMIFETFSVFLKTDDQVVVLVGVRTTKKKYAIISNQKFYSHDVDVMASFLKTASNSFYSVAEAILGDIEYANWFDTKAEAVDDCRRRLKGWVK